MKKNIFTIFLFSIHIVSYAQITFDKGYFINNSKQKIECLIKNRDWNSTPKNFEYKIIGSEQIQRELVENIEELVIYDYCKYIKAEVKIDRTTTRIDDLDKNKNPVWLDEVLFLKVMIEGEASLYSYSEGELKRFFYRISNFPIEQLVYKLYQPEGISVKKYLINAYFRQQLRLNLPCQTITDAQLQKLSYATKDLMTYFSLYHSCIAKEFIDYTPKNPKEYWHFNLILGLNATSFSYTDPNPSLVIVDFGSQISAAIGFEAEIIVPYSHKKLSFLLSPNLQAMQSSATINNNSRKLNLTFYSVSLPIGLRFYQPITPKIKAFVNLAYVFELPVNASAERNSVVNYKISLKNSPLQQNLSIGGGIRYEKWAGELRYYNTRSVFGHNPDISSNFSKISFLVSYRVF